MDIKAAQYDPAQALGPLERETYAQIVQNLGTTRGGLYVLLDTRHQSLQKHFKRWQASTYRSLWTGLISPDCSDIAPYLLQLAAPLQAGQERHQEELPEAHCLIANILAISKDQPMATWLWSDRQFDALYQHLQAWVECKTADNQSVLMHFYDNRILPFWVSVLAQEQKDAFLGIASEWWYADRDGQWQTIASEGLVPEIELPIRLTNQQENELLHANASDSILSDIASLAPELIEDKPYATNHRTVETLLKKSRAYTLDKYSDHLQFVMLGLIYGADFDQHELLQAEWGKLKSGSTPFTDIVARAHTIWDEDQESVD